MKRLLIILFLFSLLFSLCHVNDGYETNIETKILPNNIAEIHLTAIVDNINYNVTDAWMYIINKNTGEVCKKTTDENGIIQFKINNNNNYEVRFCSENKKDLDCISTCLSDLDVNNINYCPESNPSNENARVNGEEIPLRPSSGYVMPFQSISLDINKNGVICLPLLLAIAVLLGLMLARGNNPLIWFNFDMLRRGYGSTPPSLYQGMNSGGFVKGDSSLTKKVVNAGTSIGANVALKVMDKKNKKKKDKEDNEEKKKGDKGKKEDKKETKKKRGFVRTVLEMIAGGGVGNVAAGFFASPSKIPFVGKKIARLTKIGTKNKKSSKAKEKSIELVNALSQQMLQISMLRLANKLGVGQDAMRAYKVGVDARYEEFIDARVAEKMLEAIGKAVKDGKYDKYINQYINLIEELKKLANALQEKSKGEKNDKEDRLISAFKEGKLSNIIKIIEEEKIELQHNLKEKIKNESNEKIKEDLNKHIEQINEELRQLNKLKADAVLLDIVGTNRNKVENNGEQNTQTKQNTTASLENILNDYDNLLKFNLKNNKDLNNYEKAVIYEYLKYKSHYNGKMDKDVDLRTHRISNNVLLVYWAKKGEKIDKRRLSMDVHLGSSIYIRQKQSYLEENVNAEIYLNKLEKRLKNKNIDVKKLKKTLGDLNSLRKSYSPKKAEELLKYVGEIQNKKTKNQQSQPKKQEKGNKNTPNNK